MGAPAKTRAREARSQTQAQALDNLIMGTNSSSIVSKRSVEKLYYPHEPHFFRYFVTKFQRRAPVINRGYWLRLKAIDAVVRRFLASRSDKKKVVINLGCGSDVLPWQCHSRYPDNCRDAVFVDVDYPDLMRKKRAIVLATPQLRELVGSDPIVGDQDTDQVLLRSDKYCQLGCDLRKLDLFRQTLETFLKLQDCSVLFIAEVSITYMDTASADALIHWASSIGQAEFCLLEQILPSGPQHPFAQKMLSHFDKLNTSLKSVHQYPTIESQKSRFHRRGWQHVKVWDLWDAWNSDMFLNSVERAALDTVEPFDEWEEFILFARHYSVVHASVINHEMPETTAGSHVKYSCPAANIQITRAAPASGPRRRFGVPMMVSNAEGQRYAINTMGLGTNGRLPSCDVYTLGGPNKPLHLPPTGPGARLCHTLTNIGSLGYLLAGGRGSPGTVSSECWIFKRDSNTWQRTFDLPMPLFRHSAVHFQGSSLALILGGKTGPTEVSPDYFIYHPLKGWIKCETKGALPEPAFGAVALTLASSKTRNGTFHGLFSGGITQNGIINSNVYQWEVDAVIPQPCIRFELLQDPARPPLALSVFGAQTVDLDQATAVCGGVGQQASLQGQAITLVSGSCDSYQTVHLTASDEVCHQWPFMIGSSIISPDDKSLCVFGGGATCYSFGTFWETGIYTIDITNALSTARMPQGFATQEPLAMDFVESAQMTQAKTVGTETTLLRGKATIVTIPRIRLDSAGDFQDVLRNRKPRIIEGLDLGQCVDKWTPAYLVEQLGAEKEVTVHECQSEAGKMDFNSKNFRYVTESFKSFMEKAEGGGRVYLRSLSQHKPSESPANIREDLPSLSQDFQLPEELKYVKDHLFSSILRISGRVNMWLHYDVMANVYLQVRGSRRMVLFPPKDVTHLSFAPGSSSSSLDVFASLESRELAATHPREAILNAGDILFLPAMWPHAAMPTTDVSVAVNVFFRDLESGYSVGRDVYGNRDLAAYEKGRQDIAKIAKNFGRLPEDICQFYLARLGEELMHCDRG